LKTDYFSIFFCINTLVAESENQLHGLLALFISDFITAVSSAVYLVRVVLIFNFMSSTVSSGKFSSCTVSSSVFSRTVFFYSVKILCSTSTQDVS